MCDGCSSPNLAAAGQRGADRTHRDTTLAGNVVSVSYWYQITNMHYILPPKPPEGPDRLHPRRHSTVDPACLVYHQHLVRCKVSSGTTLWLPVRTPPPPPPRQHSILGITRNKTASCHKLAELLPEHQQYSTLSTSRNKHKKPTKFNTISTNFFYP